MVLGLTIGTVVTLVAAVIPGRRASRVPPLAALRDAAVGRSHRSELGKRKLRQAIDLTREVLRVPADYRIGIVPASDTGAVAVGSATGTACDAEGNTRVPAVDSGTT